MNVSEKLPAQEDTEKLSLSEPRPPSRRAFVLVAAVLLGALAWGAYGHWQRDAAATRTQEQTASFTPEVRVAVAKRLDGPVLLTLPGSVLPFDVARIYPRATGYIAERQVDIGSRVHKGDLLVRIAAPDLDQQLAQAEAQLGQMQAALLQAGAAADQARSDTQLANVTNFRTSRLAGQGWESRQNADNTRLGLSSKQAGLANAAAGVKVAEANVRAQLATVQRLQQLAEYEKVQAPFDGVVTARNIDNGDLVKADDASGGTPLFTVQRDDVVRVQVNVPQSGAVGLKDGVAGPRFHREGGAQLGGARCRIADHAGAGGREQSGRRLAAGAVRQRRFRDPAQRPIGGGAGGGGAVQRRGLARGGRGREQPCASAQRFHLSRFRHDAGAARRPARRRAPGFDAAGRYR